MQPLGNYFHHHAIPFSEGFAYNPLGVECSLHGSPFSERFVWNPLGLCTTLMQLPYKPLFRRATSTQAPFVTVRQSPFAFLKTLITIASHARFRPFNDIVFKTWKYPQSNCNCQIESFVINTTENCNFQRIHFTYLLTVFFFNHSIM